MSSERFRNVINSHILSFNKKENVKDKPQKTFNFGNVQNNFW